MEDLENMTREQLLGQIMYLLKKCDRLEDKIQELRKYEWQSNPDRMGGQFTDWEINRRGDEWA